MTDVEKIFRRDYLFSKGDILQSLELMMDYIENDPETGYTRSLRISWHYTGNFIRKWK